METNTFKQIDILAVGDLAVDVFIKIKDAEAKCDINGDHCKLCLNYGGKIPYESAEVCYATGNSSNVAISASRLGLRAGLMANIGSDKNGQDSIEKLKEEKVDTTFIKIETNKLTNYHYVLWFGGERTILVKHEKYIYEWTNTKESQEYHSPKWVYLSSLGENPTSFHDKISEYLKRHVNVKLAFQPGTFQIKEGYEKLKNIYERTDVLLCNHEEAKMILNTEEEDITKLLKKMYTLGPKIVVITDGEEGAYSFDGNEILFVKSFNENFNVVESTGAGDAFSSAFICALCKNKSISEGLLWGAINAKSAISFVGPHKGLLSEEQIEEQIKNIPDKNRPIALV